MNLESASLFLATSLMVMMGLLIIAVGSLIINYLLTKYWKPVTMFSKDSFSLFGNHGPSHYSPQLTDDEYDQLMVHLEKIRKKKPVEK